MASNIKAWRKKHADDILAAENQSLVWSICSGQWSWFCPKCGAWWSVKSGVEHQCKEREQND